MIGPFCLFLCKKAEGKQVISMCSIMGYLGTSISMEEFKKHFDETISRGPDMQKIVEIESGGIIGFERLSIMGLTKEGMQPFELNNNLLVCNGEIYCFRPIRERLSETYHFMSTSDCEILLPLYEEKGVEMFKELDAEFACIIYDAKKGSIVAARDPIGIRPLFYGYKNRFKA